MRPLITKIVCIWPKLGILILCAGYFYFELVYSNLVRTWPYGVINYKSFSNCFHFLDKASLTYSSNLCNIFRAQTIQKICRVFLTPLQQVFWISPFAIHIHFHSSTVFNDEMHLLRHIFMNMPNSFSVFIFTRHCIPIMYEREDGWSLLLAFKFLQV